MASEIHNSELMRIVLVHASMRPKHYGFGNDKAYHNLISLFTRFNEAEALWLRKSLTADTTRIAPFASMRPKHYGFGNAAYQQFTDAQGAALQ